MRSWGVAPARINPSSHFNKLFINKNLLNYFALIFTAHEKMNHRLLAVH